MKGRPIGGVVIAADQSAEVDSEDKNVGIGVV